MASRNGFFRLIRFRLDGSRKHRAVPPSACNGAATRRQSARILFPRFGCEPNARARPAGTFGSVPNDLTVTYASIGNRGVAATRNLIDSFLSVSRRYLCL